MEPPVRFELTTSALPRRRSVHWSYRGNVLGAGLQPAGTDFKDRPRMPATHPGMEPSPGADPGLLPYRGRVTAVCDGGAPAQAMAVASASRTNRRSPCLRRVLGVLGAIRTHTAQRLMPVPPPIGLRGRGAATRCRPGPSAVRRRSRSRARRRELPSEDSNLDSLIQGQEACH